MLTRVAVCGYMAAARLLELRRSRANIAANQTSQEGALSRLTYPLMVALHTTVIGGTLMRGSKKCRLPWLALLLAVQPLRFWVLSTLGERWNTRGAVSPGTVVETGGPYAFVRHPNYSVVAVELVCLPASFRLTGLAVAASVLDAGLLFARIRDEEAMLMRLPGYAEQFANTPRFLPGLF